MVRKAHKGKTSELISELRVANDDKKLKIAVRQRTLTPPLRRFKSGRPNQRFAEFNVLSLRSAGRFSFFREK